MSSVSFGSCCRPGAFIASENELRFDDTSRSDSFESKLQSEAKSDLQKRRLPKAIDGSVDMRSRRSKGGRSEPKNKLNEEVKAGIRRASSSSIQDDAALSRRTGEAEVTESTPLIPGQRKSDRHSRNPERNLQHLSESHADMMDLETVSSQADITKGNDNNQPERMSSYRNQTESEAYADRETESSMANVKKHLQGFSMTPEEDLANLSRFEKARKPKPSVTKALKPKPSVTKALLAGAGVGVGMAAIAGVGMSGYAISQLNEIQSKENDGDMSPADIESVIVDESEGEEAVNDASSLDFGALTQDELLELDAKLAGHISKLESNMEELESADLTELQVYTNTNGTIEELAQIREELSIFIKP